MGDQNAHNRADDHAEQHEGGHVVPGLHQKPHGQDGSQEEIRHDDVDPCGLGGIDRKLHAHGEHHNQQRDGDNGLHPLMHVFHMLLNQAEEDGDENEEHGNGGRCGICVGSRLIRHFCAHADEGSCHHVGEGGDDQQGEQPAEQHEQPAAGLSDVFLNHHADGFSFIFHRGIQRAEVLDRAEEQAADDEP